MPNRSAKERSFYFAASVRFYKRTTVNNVISVQEYQKTLDFEFFMNAVAANQFLDIPEDKGKTPPGGRARTIQSYTRTTALIGDTTDASTSVEGHDRTLGSGGRAGSKVLILTTGKRTQKGNYQTISVRFPSNIRIKDCLDALAEIIPESKIKSNPTATDIFPRVKLKGGRNYTLPSQSAAIATQVPNVSDSETDATSIAQAAQTAASTGG